MPDFNDEEVYGEENEIDSILAAQVQTCCARASREVDGAVPWPLILEIVLEVIAECSKDEDDFAAGGVSPLERASLVYRIRRAARESGDRIGRRAAVQVADELIASYQSASQEVRSQMYGEAMRVI